jgi:hypothetical protein
LAAVAVDGAVDGRRRVAEVPDQAAAEGDHVVLALAAGGTVTDEDERTVSDGVGRRPQQTRYRPSVAFYVEAALAYTLVDDVLCDPVHRSRLPGH